MYIYKTTNLLNKKIYVGKSEKLIAETINYYGSGVILTSAIKKYGKENFIKEIIDTDIDIESLNKKEKYWIKKLKSQDRAIGYNIADGGDGGNTGGMKEETKKKKSKVGSDGLNEFQRQYEKSRKTRLQNNSGRQAALKANLTKQKVLENGLTIAQNSARKASVTKFTKKEDGTTIQLYNSQSMKKIKKNGRRKINKRGENKQVNI